MQSVAQSTFAQCYSENNNKKTERDIGASSDALFFFLNNCMPIANSAPDVDLPALRRKLTELIAQNAVAMVQRAIDSVNEEGQYQAIKYLFEMIGLYPLPGGEEDATEASLAETLLRHLGLLDNVEQGNSSPQ